MGILYLSVNAIPCGFFDIEKEEHSFLFLQLVNIQLYVTA